MTNHGPPAGQSGDPIPLVCRNHTGIGRTPVRTGRGDARVLPSPAALVAPTSFAFPSHARPAEFAHPASLYRPPHVRGCCPLGRPPPAPSPISPVCLVVRRLCVRLGYDASLLAAVCRFFSRRLMQHLRRRLKHHLGLPTGSHLHSGMLTVKRTSSIKAGPLHLKALLVQSAWSMWRTRPNDPVVLWVRSLASKRGKRIAIVALARKIACIMWSMWRNETTYQAGFERELIPSRARGDLRVTRPYQSLRTLDLPNRPALEALTTALGCSR